MAVLDNYAEVDLKPLQRSRAMATAEKVTYTKEHEPTVRKLEYDTLILKEAMRQDFKDLEHAESLLKSTHCKCCGALLEVTEKEVEELKVTVSTLEAKVTSDNTLLDELENVASSTRETFKNKLFVLTQAEQDIDSKILVARTKNQMFSDSKTQADALRKQKTELETKLAKLQTESDIIQASLAVLKAGDIQKDLLGTFVNVLNVHLEQFLQFVSLDYITITAESSKASVSFVIHDTRFSQKISIHTLSGGEKTRLRLVALLAMLYTIKDLADISTNLLIFDESLDTLDTSATKDLANLFSYLVEHDNKFIAMISHGAQLSEVDFTGKFTATKTNGVTTLGKELS